MISDPYAWTKHGIKTISLVVSQRSLVPLSQRSSTYNIPTHYLFHYLQISHAFTTQFSQSSCMVVQSELEWVLRSECDEKPTSDLYSHFKFVSLPPLEGLWNLWQRDNPDLDNDDWDNVWDHPF